MGLHVHKTRQKAKFDPSTNQHIAYCELCGASIKAGTLSKLKRKIKFVKSLNEE